ncbi:NAD(P)-binding protein [Laetiporus sulphureus 93-53]|uniref:NAD(P)-binding protein n=1 Tax=Laetiporus sulphureus 93-53 TaxID=1314785 RepID=A0A165GE08_9APHY|nr:NAD(P)-binding protein [Laetiporus sulphureus 93-53]KZT10216.1 NAD(P)-binding protein [Laetiporus sulphureus 93-53]
MSPLEPQPRRGQRFRGGMRTPGRDSRCIPHASRDERNMTIVPSLRRIALVTGASRGIGRSIALRLADDGLDIAVNDRPSEQPQLHGVVSEIEAKGRRAVAVCADVAEESEVKDMLARTAEYMGGIDVMVANAGIAFPRSLLELSVQEWDQIMSVNLRGVMLSYKYAALQMIKQGRGGRIKVHRLWQGSEDSQISRRILPQNLGSEGSRRVQR